MKFETNNPLLMLIDLQKAIDDPRWGVRNNPGSEAQVAKLLACWRERDFPILHVKHMSTEPGSTYFPGQLGNEFKDEIVPLANEDVLEKSTNSAFIGTNLDEKLRGMGISEVVIAGVITNNSVEATARMSGNLGYRTYVVSDATFTFGLIDFNGMEHSAEDIHNISLANMQDEYATIVSAQEAMNLAAN